MAIYTALSIWVFALASTSPGTPFNSRIVANFLLSCLGILVIYRLSTYAFLPGSDMFIYLRDYEEIASLSLTKTFDYFDREPLFLTMQWVSSRFSTNPLFFLTLVSLTYVFVLSRALRTMLFPWQALLVFFSYLNFVFFYNYITIAVRQGLSMVFLLLAIGFILRQDSWRKTALSLLCAVLFHWSSLPIALALLIFRKIKLKSAILIWSMSAILFLTHTQHYIVGFISNYTSKLELYTSFSSLSAYSSSGNRTSFFLFGFAFLLFALVMQRIVRNKRYTRLISMFALANAYFLLFGFVSYSDRLAAYSWFMIPLIVWYPVFHLDKFRKPAIITMTIVSLTVGIVTGASGYLI